MNESTCFCFYHEICQNHTKKCLCALEVIKKGEHNLVYVSDSEKGNIWTNAYLRFRVSRHLSVSVIYVPGEG